MRIAGLGGQVGVETSAAQSGLSMSFAYSDTYHAVAQFASKLEEVDNAIQVSDLKVDSKVEIKNEGDQIILKVEPLREEEEELPPAPAEGEEETVEGEEAAPETPEEGEKGPIEESPKEETTA